MAHKMNFWDKPAPTLSEALAVIDENDGHHSYRQLDELVETAAASLVTLGQRKFGVLFLSNTLEGLVAYLGCLRAGHVPLLLPDELAPGLAENLITHYRPDWIMGRRVNGAALPGSGLQISNTGYTGAIALSPELGLLLSTSGSTGSPKLVRLSYAALQANATSIAAFLELGAGERALTVLPPYYSYGLSVLNSHLAAGAALVLRDLSVLNPDFITTIRRHEVTSLSGVPYIYQMMHRTGFQKQDLPSLRTLTQAGGRLDDRLTQAFGQLARERGWRFFVMYGQTEATARISFVPPPRQLDKIGSIGIPIPNGALSVDPANGELVYRGPNVMMGYAVEREHLAGGDELNGELRTGDLGRCDEDGYYYVVGRLKRFVKLAGNRVSLDEVEALLQAELAVPAAVGGRDERMVAWLETENDGMADQAKSLIAEKYGIHHSLYRTRAVDQLPLLPSGKKNYAALTADE
jgi:long-chain acyl-CoA synthetase